MKPIWWLDPTDEKALTCDSEFLIGDQLLVAPVLEDGARSRSVYLPAGRWHDELRGGELGGPRTIENYQVELSEIATFTFKH